MYFVRILFWSILQTMHDIFDEIALFQIVVHDWLNKGWSFDDKLLYTSFTKYSFDGTWLPISNWLIFFHQLKTPPVHKFKTPLFSPHLFIKASNQMPLISILTFQSHMPNNVMLKNFRFVIPKNPFINRPTYLLSFYLTDFSPFLTTRSPPIKTI